MEFLVGLAKLLLAALLLLVFVFLPAATGIFLFSRPERRAAPLVRPQPSDSQEEICICCGEVRRKYSERGGVIPPAQVNPGQPQER